MFINTYQQKTYDNIDNRKTDPLCVLLFLALNIIVHVVINLSIDIIVMKLFVVGDLIATEKSIDDIILRTSKDENKYCM